MDDFDNAALAFLRALLSKDQTAAQQHFRTLEPRLRARIERAAESWPNVFRRQRDVELDDLVQWVLLRLWERPPEQELEDERRAPARLLAWITTTTCNRLADLAKKKAAERMEDVPEPENEHDPEERLHQRDAERRVEQIQQLLEREYPAGERLFEAMRAEPELSGEELAERLNTSRANVFTIRTRMRRLIARRMSD